MTEADDGHEPEHVAPASSDIVRREQRRRRTKWAAFFLVLAGVVVAATTVGGLGRHASCKFEFASHETLGYSDEDPPLADHASADDVIHAYTDHNARFVPGTLHKTGNSTWKVDLADGRRWQINLIKIGPNWHIASEQPADACS